MATFEVIFILALIILQIFVFVNILNKICNFKNFFPKPYSIEIKKQKINADESVELLNDMENNKQFDEIITSTNEYLLKNRGAAADFNILKDICERHLEKFDNEIGNLINVPLYIGLGGTFVGIIIGLLGIVGWDSFLELFGISQKNTTEILLQNNINHLLQGVIFAMSASFVGLIFTVINSWYYKSAAYKSDDDRNLYYNLLQRELLPSLNTGVAKSLGNLNIVLNEFLKKFGENMDDYRDSGRLLNENLNKQQSVLEEINKLSLTKTSTKIVEIFASLNESSKHLEKFIDYQKGLNEYVDKSEEVTEEMKSIIGYFKDFNMNLKAIGNITLSSIGLQKQFKDSLEKHFPTIDDHREIWRGQIDELNKDVRKVYSELYNYFKEQTEQVKGFVDNNNNFFSEIEEIKKAVLIFVENSNAQKTEFSILKEQITGLRTDFKESQKDYINTNISLLSTLEEIKKDKKTIEMLIRAIKSLKISDQQNL